MYIIRFERILKTRSENSETLGKVCSITIFHRNPEKNTFADLKNPLNGLSSSHLFFRQSWTKVLGHFCISGCFPAHTGPTPPLTPQTMLDACIQNFFRVSTLYRVRGGRELRKGCTVLRGNREMTEKYEYCSTVPRTFVQDCRYNITETNN